MNYVLHCTFCNFKMWSDGSKESTKDLVEVTSCVNCGGKKFKCPKCGYVIKVQKYVEPPLPHNHFFEKN